MVNYLARIQENLDRLNRANNGVYTVVMYAKGFAIERNTSSIQTGTDIAMLYFSDDISHILEYLDGMVEEL